MITITRFRELLDACCARLPEALFTQLNGGVLLLPEVKLHPKARAKDLFVLGEYRHTRTMGRTVVLFYGSFEQAFPHLTEELLCARMDATLRHELLHHLESLAGERELEKDDERRLRAYLNA